jgi:hypothetical protein
MNSKDNLGEKNYLWFLDGCPLDRCRHYVQVSRGRVTAFRVQYEAYIIVFLDKTEPEFSEWSLARARQHAQIDDRPDRPVVYIDVGKLSPRRSRLVRPRIMRDPGKNKRQPVAA